MPINSKAAGFNSHAVTPTGSGGVTLTRTSDVLLVLQNGGRIVTGDRRGPLELIDRDGDTVPAWQTALKNAKARREQQS